jgi:sporulation protein YlmC with PRC-barrel domain
MAQTTDDARGATGTATGLTGSARSQGARITGASHHDDDSGPGPEIMAASSFEDEKVVNAQGEDLGEIEEIMLDVRSGRIAYAVLASGGFLGIGEKYFAIPWNALTLDTDHKCFILDISKDQLKNAPGFDKDNWPAMADLRWASSIHGYYRTTPYWE